MIKPSHYIFWTGLANSSISPLCELIINSTDTSMKVIETTRVKISLQWNTCVTYGTFVKMYEEKQKYFGPYNYNTIVVKYTFGFGFKYNTSTT